MHLCCSFARPLLPAACVRAVPCCIAAALPSLHSACVGNSAAHAQVSKHNARTSNLHRMRLFVCYTMNAMTALCDPAVNPGRRVVCIFDLSHCSMANIDMACLMMILVGGRRRRTRGGSPHSTTGQTMPAAAKAPGGTAAAATARPAAGCFGRLLVTCEYFFAEHLWQFFWRYPHHAGACIRNCPLH